jgi:hypothetical protein
MSHSKWFIALFLVITSLHVAASETQVSVDVEGFTGPTPSRFLITVDKSLTKTLRVTASFDKETNGYLEGYVGPTWAPTELLSLGVGFGRESAPNSFRKAAWLDLGSDEGTLLEALFEDGKSGAWHRVSLVTKISERINLGVMHETDVGLGPRVEITANKHFKLWGSVLRNADKDTTAVLAISISR